MDNKNNRVLLGVIILLLGIYSIVQKAIPVDYGSVTIVFFGLALLVLYKTKRKSWSLIFGVYIVYFGMVVLLMKLGFEDLDTVLIGPAFFIVPGIIFLVLYLQKNKTALLFPGSALFWLGICLVLDNLNLSIFSNGGLFPVCAGLAFLTTFFLGKSKKWLFYSAVFLILIGMFKMITGTSIGSSLIQNIFSVILIGISLFLIFGNKKRK